MIVGEPQAIGYLPKCDPMPTPALARTTALPPGREPQSVGYPRAYRVDTYKPLC